MISSGASVLNMERSVQRYYYENFDSLYPNICSYQDSEFNAENLDKWIDIDWIEHRMAKLGRSVCQFTLNGRTINDRYLVTFKKMVDDFLGVFNIETLDMYDFDEDPTIPVQILQSDDTALQAAVRLEEIGPLLRFGDKRGTIISQSMSYVFWLGRLEAKTL